MSQRVMSTPKSGKKSMVPNSSLNHWICIHQSRYRYNREWADHWHNLLALGGREILQEFEGRDIPHNFIQGRERLIGEIDSARSSYDHETGEKIYKPLDDEDF